MRTALGNALSERVMSLARANERLQAVDDSRDHVVDEPNARAVLLHALAALSSEEEYELAGRILAGERISSADGLARAGLAVWDPGSDSVRPTALLIELMHVFDAAVKEAQE